MTFGKLHDFSRLCLHTITTKPLSIEEAADSYSAAGIKGMTIWRDALQNRNIHLTGERIRKNGLDIVSLCRGGFFPSLSETGRKNAIADNKKLIDEAAEAGAPLVVLVCGAVRGQTLETSRHQIIKALDEIVPYAGKQGIKLGIEPLHPMYADTRSAINTMKQANDIAMMFRSPYLGVVIDVFHVWWDPDLESEIIRCGQKGNIFAFHLSDWKADMEHMLNDRGLMGEGFIPLQAIREWVENAGFNGFLEVEIFSNRYWSLDQKKFIRMIKDAYITYC